MGNRGWFLADLTRCEHYLAQLGLHPVCDGAAKAHVLDRLDPDGDAELIERYGDVLDRVPVFTSKPELWEYVVDHPDSVWIGAGCQFGLLFKAEEVPLTPGRLMGVFGFSVLSGSYGSISLYPWTGRGSGGMGLRLVRFHRGELEVPEPEPEYDEDGEPDDSRDEED